MAITFVVIMIVLYLITMARPLPEPKVLPQRKDFDMTPAPIVKALGATVIVLTVILYAIFW